MATANIATGLPQVSSSISYVAFCLTLVSLIVALATANVWIRRDLAPADPTIGGRIQPIAWLEMAPPSNSATAKGMRSGVLVAYEYCRSCHSSGEGGAPKIGDRKDWAPRMNQGMGSLVQSVISGRCGAAKAGSDTDEMELARAVVYMIWPRMRL